MCDELENVFEKEDLKLLPLSYQLITKVEITDSSANMQTFVQSDFHNTDMHHDNGQYKPISTIYND